MTVMMEQQLGEKEGLGGGVPPPMHEPKVEPEQDFWSVAFAKLCFCFSNADSDKSSGGGSAETNTKSKSKAAVVADPAEDAKAREKASLAYVSSRLNKVKENRLKREAELEERMKQLGEAKKNLLLREKQLSDRQRQIVIHAQRQMELQNRRNTSEQKDE